MMEVIQQSSIPTLLKTGICRSFSMLDDSMKIYLLQIMISTTKNIDL